MMEKLAECEGFVLLINRSGGLEFYDREARTTTSEFTFNGAGYLEMNIIKMIESKEAFNKYYNFFRFQWAEEDTTTSFVTAGTATSIAPSNTSWKFGSRVYEFDNTLVPTSTSAQTIVNNLFNLFSIIKNEVRMDTKFVPQLEISDRVTLNYESDGLESEGLIWDAGEWDAEDWADSTNININNADYKILSKQHNLDDFKTTLSLRAI